MRRLTDKPDTVQESSDNSEQNQGGWIFDYFLKIFCTGPLFNSTFLQVLSYRILLFIDIQLLKLRFILIYIADQKSS